MAGPQIAIVGAGPAGCYTALALSKAVPSAEIAVLDRLPIPYGLIRYGVAADHQGTKAVTAQFERLFTAGAARFLGGIQVGRDISAESLLDAFDLVVWAGGLSRDRRLGIAGEGLRGVYGSGEVSRAWNAHPLQPWEHITIGPRVVLAGAGNVALDLVRLLAKREAELTGSDLDEVFAATVPERVREITVVARGSAGDVRWDAGMLRELAAIEGCAFELGGRCAGSVTAAAAAGHAASTVLAGLVAQTEEQADSAPRVRIRFLFGTRILAAEGEDLLRSVVLDDGDGPLHLPADTLLTAIGFEGDELPADPRIVRIGWAKTGPRGTIPTLRTAARELAAAAQPTLPEVSERAGVDALGGLAGVASGFDDWQRIDSYELATAAPGRCRRKLRDLTALPLIAAEPASPSEHESAGRI